MSKILKVRIGDNWYTVEVGDLNTNPVRVLVDGDLVEVDAVQSSLKDDTTPELDIEETDTEQTPVEEAANLPPTIIAKPNAVAKPAAVKVFRSPMPGIIVSIMVKEGEQVVTGDEICVLEAMKMQQSLRAEWTGIVKTVHVSEGQQIGDGDAIIDLE